MSVIFINYRRNDSAAYAGRIYDRLAKHFGHENCFMDIDHIAPGEDFKQVIQEKLSAVKIAVVLIGKQWLNIKDDNGQRRLDNPDDLVRLEIATLLARDIRVVPVLVGGADIPDAAQLPEPLVPLTKRSAYEISDTRFHADIDRLIQALEEIVDVKRLEENTKQKKKTRKNKKIAFTAMFSIMEKKIAFTVSISIIALIIIVIPFLSNPGENITQKTHGGDAIIHQGTGGINTGDTIIHHHEYDEEKLIALADQLAQRYRAQDVETIKELERAVTALSQQDADKYDIQQALDLLSEGKTEEAEKIFELVALDARKKGQEENLKEAEARRHIGALAFLHDTQKSFEAYQRSTELDPDNKDGWNQLGHLYRRIGELAQAERTYLKVLTLAGTDKEYQAIAYGNLGLVYRTQGNLTKAIEFFEKALAIDESMGNKAGMAIAYGNLGNVYYIQGNLTKAIEFFEKALAIDESMGNKAGMAIAYNSLGLVHYTQEDLTKAIEFHEKALAIDESMGNKEGMAIAYNNLGNVYYTQEGDLTKAVEFYEKALAINEAMGNKEGMATAYGNLGLVHRIQGDLIKAIEFYEKALAINEAMGNKEGMATAYGNLGLVHRIQEDLTKAIEFHEKALAIDESMGNKEGMAIAYGNLGLVHQIQGDLIKAIEFYEKALAIDETMGRKKGMANQYGNLGIVYDTQGDLTKAVEYWQKSLALYTEIGAVREIEKVQSLLDTVDKTK